MPPRRYQGQTFGLPLRVFLYTLDQISQMLEIEYENLVTNYIYFEGRTISLPKAGQLKARNIAPREDEPEWRIADQELLRWLRFKGFKIIERGWVKS